MSRLDRIGSRVRIARITDSDVPALRAAMEQSRDRIAPWGPIGVDGVEGLPALQSASNVTMLVHALDPEGGHGIVGRVNVVSIVRGRGQLATLGYDAYDPYAGRGLLAEGLCLVVGMCFADEPDGLGLHRLSAGVQPGNVRSAGLLRGLGFRPEGHSPRLVDVPSGDDLSSAWRDHDLYGIDVSEWPPTPYAAPVRPRIACLVNGLPGSGKSTLATRLATELGLPLYRKDLIKESVADATGTVDPEVEGRVLGQGASFAMWALFGESPVGGIVETWAPQARDAGFVEAGLTRAGFDPARVPEVWCDVPVELARARDAARWEAGTRHTVHRAVGDDEWRGVLAEAAPLGIGPVLRVDTSAPMTDADVVRLALQIRAINLARHGPAD